MQRPGSVAERRTAGRPWGRMAVVLLCMIWGGVGLASRHGATASAQPAGEMRWAVYVTLSPAWFDPGEVANAGITPFWVLYAIHDALLKPMPGVAMAPSLAESWTESADGRTYEFKLREGLTFHNGDPFTAEDVKFSLLRYRWSQHQRDKIREVEIVDPYRVRIHLHTPWPDFMTYYGTLATGAAWIVPKKYLGQVGDDGFKKHPIGLGPYKFVSYTPGVELVMEAFAGYWRKTPQVQRLVFKVATDATTRMAMLKKGEVDIAYDLDVPMAEAIKQDPKLKLAFSGGIATFWLAFFEQWDAKSPWHDQRVRLAASYAIDRQALSESETLGASIPTGSLMPRQFDFVLPLETQPYNPAKAKQLLAEAGYPHGFDAGDLTPSPPYFSMGEAIANYLGAVGIKVNVRTMERAAFIAALNARQLRGVCVCGSGRYGNVAARLEEAIVSGGRFAYGGYADIDGLFQQQDAETDRGKRTTLLHHIQQLVHERVVVAPIWDYVWPSGIGPRVEEPALMLINPYPWSAPLEEVRLK